MVSDSEDLSRPSSSRVEGVVEGMLDQNLHCIMTFIVFRKAFNSIHRGKMKMILDTICQGSEKKTEAVVPSADGETETHTSAGVLQGETLQCNCYRAGTGNENCHR